MSAARALVGLAPRVLLALAAACSSRDVTLTLPASDPAGLTLPHTEGSVPLPECPNFDYSRCDIREQTCLENLGAIARCLHGSNADLPLPGVSFWSEATAAADFRSELPERQATPDHFEIALARFGLTEPGALEPDTAVERLAQALTAYYDHARGDIVVIEHAESPDPLGQDSIVVHEMIHAFQDQEHDLREFEQRYRQGNDGNLRGASIIEGEARMHERRYFAALAGLDVSVLDLAQSFRSITTNTERWLWSQADLYTASQLSVPYAHGAEYLYGVWAEGGQAAVRALFDAPPASMQPILAAVWGGPSTQPFTPYPPPASSALPGVALAAWTTMGAWGVYLIAARGLDDVAAAEHLALDWRADQLEVFTFAKSETAARWRIRLGTSESAAQLVEIVAGEPLIEATHDGSTVTLRTATAAAPAGL